jgi:hypothetical protein
VFFTILPSPSKAPIDIYPQPVQSHIVPLILHLPVVVPETAFFQSYEPIRPSRPFDSTLPSKNSPEDIISKPKMRLSAITAIVAIALPLVHAEQKPIVDAELQKPLDIKVTHAVECERKSRKNDAIEVHYKGTLLDGSLTPLILKPCQSNTLSRRHQVRLVVRPQLSAAPDPRRRTGHPRLGRGPEGHVRGREAHADHSARVGVRGPGHGTHSEECGVGL